MTRAGCYAFVDWDDTLKVTNALYDRVSLANAKLVISHLGIADADAAMIRERVHAVDLAKVRALGLSPEHFPVAWVETYEAMAREKGVAISPELARRLYVQAANVVNLPQDDCPGARDLLAALRQRGYEITIWTSGDQAVQEAKIQRAGFRALVDRVVVVQDKSPAILRVHLGGRPAGKTCVIGNSPRADVLPALDVGAWAVHVQQDTWGHDEALIDTSNPRYLCVESLKEIPILLDRILAPPWVTPRQLTS